MSETRFFRSWKSLYIMTSRNWHSNCQIYMIDFAMLLLVRIEPHNFYKIWLPLQMRSSYSQGMGNQFTQTWAMIRTPFLLLNGASITPKYQRIINIINNLACFFLNKPLANIFSAYIPSWIGRINLTGGKSWLHEEC